MSKLFSNTLIGYNKSQVNDYIKSLKNKNMNLRLKNSKLADKISAIKLSKKEQHTKAEAISNSIITAEQFSQQIKNKSKVLAKKSIGKLRMEQRTIIAENYNLRQDIKDLRKKSVNFLKTSISAIKDPKWQRLSVNNKKKVFKDSFNLVNRQSRKNIIKSDERKAHSKVMVKGKMPSAVTFYPNGSSKKF